MIIYRYVIMKTIKEMLVFILIFSMHFINDIFIKADTLLALKYCSFINKPDAKTNNKKSIK